MELVSLNSNRYWCKFRIKRRDNSSTPPMTMHFILCRASLEKSIFRKLHIAGKYMYQYSHFSQIMTIKRALDSERQAIVLPPRVIILGECMCRNGSQNITRTVKSGAMFTTGNGSSGSDSPG